MKYGKIKFKDALKFFTFTQFYEICRIFEVDTIDRGSIAGMGEKVLEAKDDSEIAKEIGKTKLRRDFDKMTEELIEKYEQCGRRNRRTIDRICAKIVWGNKAAEAQSTPEQAGEALKIVSDRLAQSPGDEA